MRALVCGLALFLLGTSAVLASPAKEASIRELMAVTHAQRLAETVSKQFDTMMKKSVRRTLNGRIPSLKQEQAIAHMEKSMHALLSRELAWDKLEPAYLRMYRETFSEEEIQGMLAFYRTPAGRAVIKKMPLLMRKTVSYTQQIIRESSPQMRQIIDQFRADMKAASD